MRTRGAVVGSAVADALRVIALQRPRGRCRRYKPLLCVARKDLLDALVDALRLTTVYNAPLVDTGDPPWNSPAVLNSPADAAPSAAAVARFDAIQCRLASDHHGRCINLQRAFSA